MTIHHIPETASTNDWIRARAAELADGDWVVADRQTAGRGRQGRAWHSMPGNLFASCLIRPAVGERPRPLMSFAAALALHDACAALVPADRLLLKWPNDLLLDGAKLSGILMESIGDDAMVLGVGVNLAGAPDVPGRAVAALAEAAPAPAPLAFAAVLAEALVRRRNQWRSTGFAAIRSAWLQRAHPLGTPLSIATDGRAREVRFAGLDDDGALRFVDADGIGRLLAGDVMLAGEAMPADREPA